MYRIFHHPSPNCSWMMNIEIIKLLLSNSIIDEKEYGKMRIESVAKENMALSLANIYIYKVENVKHL